MRAGWSACPLGELVEFYGGGTPSRKEPAYWGGTIAWASVKDIGSTDLAETAESITEAGLAESSARLVPPGTVILVTRVGIGKVCINSIPVAINQDLKALVPRRDDLLPRFLLYLLMSKAQAIDSLSVGATVKGISVQTLQRLRVLLPPRPEQQRIVRILDEAEALRRLRSDADRRMEDVVPAIFHQMFGEKQRAVARWPSRSVAQLADQGKGSIRTGPFGSQLRHSEFVAEGVPVLGIDNVVSNRFRWTRPRALPPDRYAEFTRYRVFPGDVLITIMGTVGRAAVAPADLPECMSTKHLCVITPDTRQVIGWYLWGGVLFDPVVRAQASGSGGGAIMEGWNMGIIQKLRLPVPPLALQERFAQAVCAANRIADQQESAGMRLDATFDSLLLRAFRGEL